MLSQRLLFQQILTEYLVDAKAQIGKCFILAVKVVEMFLSILHTKCWPDQGNNRQCIVPSEGHPGSHLSPGFLQHRRVLCSAPVYAGKKLKK